MVVAVGGDGTIHEIINDFIIYSNAVVGMIPFGSGNDFAKGYYIPTEPLLAIDFVTVYNWRTI